MTQTTDALVVASIGGDVELTPVVLNPIQPTEVLVEIHATGVCNTDLSCMAGKLPAEFPNVLGHEGKLFLGFILTFCHQITATRVSLILYLGAGVVVQIGNSVDNVQVGDKVLLSYNFCRECTVCTTGSPMYCENMFQLNFGGRRLDNSRAIALQDGTEVFSNFFGQSSFCRRAIVSQSSVVPVPAETPLELFAPLGCGLQTGAGSVVNSLNIQAGSSIAIAGVGSVGLSAVMAAKFREAAIIIAIDISPERLDLAKSLGATHTIFGSEDVVRIIRDICQPFNGVQFAVDCSGVPAVVENLVDSLGSRGRAVSVGGPAPGKRAGVNVFDHLNYGREYRGSHQGDSIAKEVCPCRSPWLCLGLS